MTIPARVGLFADLYELTMAAAYADAGVEDEAVFELFVRSLPEDRAFLVASGVDDAVDGVLAWRYGDEELAYLASLDLFTPAFLDRLRGLRFSGEIRAVADGEIVFAGEPLVSVRAPVIEAQLVETWLLNTIGHATMLASKAARVAIACAGTPFVDFSARRDHGAEAAMEAARAAWIAGAAGTSLVDAAARYGIPASGTMAHSFVMAFADERDAFRAFLRTYPRNAILLVDTYDTLEGTRRAIEVLTEARADGVTARGVRLDSGDLGALARQVRAMLDAAGFPDVQIIVSGDLDEFAIAELVASGSPIDGYGVGTRMGTSADHPYVSVVYKLVELGGTGRAKTSAGKVTVAGEKQVWRRVTDATWSDLVTARDEPAPDGARALLTTVVEKGTRVVPRATLAEARARCAAGLAALPEAYRVLRGSPRAPVQLSPRLVPAAR